jgi:hypothetical protein
MSSHNLSGKDGSYGTQSSDVDNHSLFPLDG